MKIFISLLLVLSFNTFARNEKGNGGGVHYCENKVTVYDLYEGRVRYDIDVIEQEELDKEQTISFALEKVGKRNKRLKKLITEKIVEVEKKLSVRDIEIERTLDADSLYHDNGCEYKQAANWDDEIDKIIVAKYIWEKLTPFQKGVLLFHEAAYGVARDKSDAQTSTKVRKFVAEIFSSLDSFKTYITPTVDEYGSIEVIKKTIEVTKNFSEEKVYLQGEAFRIKETKEPYEGTCSRQVYDGEEWYCPPKIGVLEQEPCYNRPTYTYEDYSCAKVRTIKTKISEGEVNANIKVSLEGRLEAFDTPDVLEIFIENKEIKINNPGSPDSLNHAYTISDKSSLEITDKEPYEITGHLVIEAVGLKHAKEMLKSQLEPVDFKSDSITIKIKRTLEELKYMRFTVRREHRAYVAHDYASLKDYFLKYENGYSFFKLKFTKNLGYEKLSAFRNVKVKVALSADSFLSSKMSDIPAEAPRTMIIKYKTSVRKNTISFRSVSIGKQKLDFKQ